MSSSKTFDLYLACNSKNQDPAASVDYLAEYYGDDIFQRLLNSLLGKKFSEQEAIDLWRAAMSSFNSDKARTNWRAVILDYLLCHTEMLKNPRIIDADELKRLKTEAITDGLTGLCNQAHFKDQLSVEIRKHKASPGSVFSLLILDLDHFKQFNDRCGHLRGDRALATTGQLICSQLPANALAARYGGEEFAILLPETDLPQAIEIAEKIRLKIAQEEFDGEERLDSGRLTISGGIACFPAAGTTSDALISHADGKLYEAKVTRNSIYPQPNNSRSIPRHSYRNIVEIFHPDSGEFKNSLSADISQTGILLKSSTPAVIGHKVKLRFPYPFWPNNHQILGEVKHTRRSGRKGAFLVGIEFQQQESEFLQDILPVSQQQPTS